MKNKTQIDIFTFCGRQKSLVEGKKVLQKAKSLVEGKKSCRRQKSLVEGKKSCRRQKSLIEGFCIVVGVLVKDGAGGAGRTISEFGQTPIPSHPGTKYAVRANPSLRCFTLFLINSGLKANLAQPLVLAAARMIVRDPAVLECDFLAFCEGSCPLREAP